MDLAYFIFHFSVNTAHNLYYTKESVFT